MPRLELETVEVVGTKEIVANLQKLGLAAVPSLAAGLYQEAEGTMTVAKTLTPMATGNLRASGHVAPPAIEGSVVTVAMGFGGPAGTGNQGATNTEDVGYAVYVHENMESHHPVGQAKFLETAAKQRTQGMAGRLASVLARRYQEIVRRGTA